MGIIDALYERGPLQESLRNPKRETTVESHPSQNEGWGIRAKRIGAPGRWLSPDPAGASWNAYQYSTNPLVELDPSGLSSIEVGAQCGDHMVCNWSGDMGQVTLPSGYFNTNGGTAAVGGSAPVTATVTATDTTTPEAPCASQPGDVLLRKIRLRCKTQRRASICSTNGSDLANRTALEEGAASTL
jgi:hypothetical protein